MKALCTPVGRQNLIFLIIYFALRCFKICSIIGGSGGNFRWVHCSLVPTKRRHQRAIKKRRTEMLTI